MKKPTYDPNLINQLLAVREKIDDILDGGGGDIVEKPAKETAKAAKPARSRGRVSRGPGGAPAAGAGGGKKLAIVVGHTAMRPGASGVAPVSASEYPWNKDLASKIVSECSALGATAAVFFRDTGGISGAYSGVAASGAKAVIELHFNANGGAARGTETLYGTACAASKDWAQRVQETMVALYSRSGGTNRGLKKTPPHPRGGESVNALSTIPSCLIEPFFGDHTGDATLGQTKKDALAKALAKAFVTHFP
jgi:N-acetylmuramoyl-L-alanine amidase